MCSIVGSFDKEKLIELCKLNEYRGQQSFSISYYKNGILTITHRKRGPIDYNLINIKEKEYCIIHMQAPTETTNPIHPATAESIEGFYFLWHNGILKEHTIEMLNKETNLTMNAWDSKALLESIVKNRSHKEISNRLSSIDGSFSCLLYSDKALMLFLFRNKLAPMYIDENFNISSTVFDKSKSLPPDTFFEFNPANKQILALFNFETYVNPYYFEEENE